ncbi:eukaryotic translation initiation factor eIF2A-domain-containing protein [Cyathus striatus]|nr:eukaryotic translation initiation factor eIF2A-domain-containing protein [Cyathus striatus]
MQFVLTRRCPLPCLSTDSIARGIFVYIGKSRLGRYVVLHGVWGVRSLGLFMDISAKTTLFDQRVRALHDFGSGRLISLAGFGDLTGEMDVFDRKMLAKVTTIDSPNTSHCEWSPCGRFLLTATLSHSSASTTVSTYGNAPAHCSMSNQSKSCTKCRTSTGSCLRGKCQGASRETVGC